MGWNSNQRSHSDIDVWWNYMYRAILWCWRNTLKVLLPLDNATFPNNNYRFQQDNDPKHKTKISKHVILMMLWSFSAFFKEIQKQSWKFSCNLPAFLVLPNFTCQWFRNTLENLVKILTTFYISGLLRPACLHRTFGFHHCWFVFR